MLLAIASIIIFRHCSYLSIDEQNLHFLCYRIDVELHRTIRESVCITYFLLSTAEPIAGNVAIRCGAPGVLLLKKRYLRCPNALKLRPTCC